MIPLVKYRLREIGNLDSIPDLLYGTGSPAGINYRFDLLDREGLHPRDLRMIRLMEKHQLLYVREFDLYVRVRPTLPPVTGRIEKLAYELGQFMTGPLLDIEFLDEFIVNCSSGQFDYTATFVYGAHREFSSVLPIESLSWDIWTDQFHPLFCPEAKHTNARLLSLGLPDEYHRKIIRHQAIQVDARDHQVSFHFAKRLEKLPIAKAYELLKTYGKYTHEYKFPILSKAIIAFDTTGKLPSRKETLDALTEVLMYRATAEMKNFCKERAFIVTHRVIRLAIRALLVQYTSGDGDCSDYFRIYKEFINAESHVRFLSEAGNEVSDLVHILNMAFEFIDLVSGIRRPLEYIPAAAGYSIYGLCCRRMNTD